MSIEKEIEKIKKIIDHCLENPNSESYKDIMPSLEKINEIFIRLTDNEKAQYNQKFDELYFFFQKFEENEKKIQREIKNEIRMIDKKSNAFNAYNNASNLGY